MRRRSAYNDRPAVRHGRRTTAPGGSGSRRRRGQPADVSRLQELGKLHEQGILTDEEFAQQKALILGTR